MAGNKFNYEFAVAVNLISELIADVSNSFINQLTKPAIH